MYEEFDLSLSHLHERVRFKETSVGVMAKKAVNHLKSQEELDEGLLKHISPLNWAHINFMGEYSSDTKRFLRIIN